MVSSGVSRGEQLTDVIKRYLVGAPTEVGSIDLASLRRRLDAAALLIEPALAARGIDAIALTKEKIGALGDCERFAAALLSGRTSLGNVDAMARGVLFETLVRSHVTRGVRAGVARTKHQRERLSGRVAPGPEGMKAIAVLVLCTWQIRSGELREPVIGSGRWWWWRLRRRLWCGRQSGRRWACRGGRRWRERSSARSGPSSDELQRG